MAPSILRIEEEQEVSRNISIGDRIKAGASGYPRALMFLPGDVQVNRKANDEGKVYGFYRTSKTDFVGIIRDDGTCAAYTYDEVID